MCIAFYFLLQVGECTKPRHKTKTVQFRLRDVAFWKKGKRVDLFTAEPSALIACDGATLRIEHQKNGRKNQTIYHEANGFKTCPVKQLALLALELRKISTDPNTLLCTFKQHNSISHVVNKGITTLLRQAAIQINLPAKGFPLHRICPHSLRAGGATALKLGGWDVVTIQKYGRWTSTTFLTYIHEQIAHLGKNVSKSMGQQRNFFNVAGFD